MKQSSVEYLVEQLERIGFSTNNIVEFENEIQISKEMEKQQKGYSEEEVLKLLIYCKNKFGGSGLEDYTHDDEVKEWFELNKKK